MSPDAIAHALTLLVAAVFGATIGSFLNVCIWRLPRQGLRVNRPARSFCPLCGDGIAWFDNLPILSWMWLGGRCRSCRAPISIRYPMVEALTAALFVVVVERFGFELGGGVVACIVLLILLSALLVANAIDIDLRILPDEITIGGLHLVPLAVFLLPDLWIGATSDTVGGLAIAWRVGLLPLADSLPSALTTPVGAAVLSASAFALAFPIAARLYWHYRRWRLPDAPRGLVDVSLAGWLAGVACALLTYLFCRPEAAFLVRAQVLACSLFGLFVGSSIIWLVGVIGTRLFRKPAMGFGDVKLMGLLGALTGWQGAVVGFFIACLLGSIFGIVRLLVSRDRYLPFGPFLTIGALSVYLWADAFSRAFEWYLQLFRPGA